MNSLRVARSDRASLKAQKPLIVWFTGISGAGKSTIARLLERELASAGRHTYLLDGDELRAGLNRDLGFSADERIENMRRVAEVARLMMDAGLIVLVALISPFRAQRDAARRLVARDEFIEVHVDTPLEVAEQRDEKGLYRKARQGLLPDFTGIGSPYEAPVHPELRIDTCSTSAQQAVAQLMELLDRHRAAGGAESP
jgi:bifunctional enzyme CysN/CysC